MKKMRKILLWLLILFFGTFLVSYIFIGLFGKQMVVSAIEKNLRMKASLSGINLELPFNIRLTNLEIGNLFKSQSIVASPNILGFFAGKILFNKIILINPIINIKLNQDGSSNLPDLAQKGKAPAILLAGLEIRNGKLIFADAKISTSGFTFVVNKLNARISKAMIPPTSLNTKFSFSADFQDLSGKGLGSTDGSGWIDFGPKDMDAVFNIRGLDVVYFYPYYVNNIIGKQPESGTLDLESILKAKSNNLNIASKIKLSNLAYAKKEAGKAGEITGAELLTSALGVFTNKTGDITFDFNINTKLDKFTLKASEIRKTFLKAAANNIADQPPDELADKVNNIAGQFKEIGKQFKDMFKKKE